MYKSTHYTQKISELENLISIQRDCLNDYSPYMVGLLNGLVCAHSTITGTPPNYQAVRRRRRINVKIRHRRVKLAKIRRS